MSTGEEVLSTLNEIGPSLSSVLAHKLQADLNLSPAAARKRIERAKNDNLIKSLDKLSLKHKEQFLFTDEQTGSPDFRRALLNALDKSSYRTALSGVMGRGSIVPHHLFSTFSGLPISDLKEGLTGEACLDQLREWDLLRLERTRAGLCVVLPDYVSKTRVGDRRLIGRLLAEDLLLLAFRDWLQNQGLIAHEAASLRTPEELPQFGYFNWDLVAPSYSAPFRTHSPSGGILPGFVVADVILGRRLTLDDVQFFIAKCNAVRSRRNNRPFLAFLVADWFERDAFELGRKFGYTFTTVKNLFGVQFHSGLDSLVQIVENKDSDKDTDHVENIVDAIYSVAHLRSALHAVKDKMLDVLLGMLVVLNDRGLLEYSRTFWNSETDTDFEVDLIFTGSEKVHAIECKYSVDQIGLEFVRTWFQLNVPVLHQIMSRHNSYGRGQRFEFSMWTNGHFSNEAIDYMSTLSRSISQYAISWKSQDDLETAFNAAPERLSDLFSKIFSEDAAASQIQAEGSNDE
jgi:hypothetical protein